MEITWLGYCSFLLRGSSLAIVTDPFDESLGLSPGRVQADAVTVSCKDPHHGHLDMVSGYRKTLSGPGEYEVSDVFISGVRTFRDAVQGAERGRNTVYRFLIDGITICHLGAIGHVPTPDQVTTIGEVGVLFVPVGGGGALSPAQAAEVVTLLEPRVIIPMHYRTPGLALSLEPVDEFLKGQGASAVEPVQRLALSATSVPSGPQVVVLEPRPPRR